MRSFVLVVLAFIVITADALNNRPIIGILTLPCDASDCGSHTEYLPASYVKSIESSGARVVPIHYTAAAQQITSLLSNLNGVLFTGGGASLDDGSPYFTAIQTIYSYVVNANAEGDFFPLWGTCLGFESICRAASADPNVLTPFDSENYTIPLIFTDQAQDSRVFNSSLYPSALYVMSLLSSLNVTMNNHAWGVSPFGFSSRPALADVFDVLATDLDRKGVEFVSLIQGKDVPIYASQFHPEKPQFEWWSQEVTSHTSSAVVANSYMMEFLVNEARKSDHTFGNGSVIDFIYRYNPVFTNSEFVQCYYW